MGNGRVVLSSPLPLPLLVGEVAEVAEGDFIEEKDSLLKLSCSEDAPWAAAVGDRGPLLQAFGLAISDAEKTRKMRVVRRERLCGCYCRSARCCACLRGFALVVAYPDNAGCCAFKPTRCRVESGTVEQLRRLRTRCTASRTRASVVCDFRSLFLFLPQSAPPRAAPTEWTRNLDSSASFRDTECTPLPPPACVKGVSRSSLVGLCESRDPAARRASGRLASKERSL